jgi:drug/metabolite transporter (DMT)-like permease
LSRGPRPELILVAVTVLWGSTFIVTKDVVRGMAPLPYLVLRFGVAALVLGALLHRRLPPTRSAFVDGAVLGFMNSAGLLLQVFGQVYTTASHSSFITSLNTPLTPLVGLALYRARPSRPQLVAVVLATVGTMLLTWPPAGTRWNRGDLLTVGCAVLYAFTIVEIARRTPRHDPLVLTVMQLGSAALTFAVALGAARVWLAAVGLPAAPEMLLLEARPFALDGKLIAEILYMSIVCSVVTFTAQTWAMARMSATHAAIVFALEPVFATAMAIGVDGSAEWPGARGAIGAALVLLAVVVSEIRLPRRRPPE